MDDHDKIVADLGRRVHGIRKSRRMSLDAVANRAGLSKSYVWEIEQGQQTNPSLLTLLSLAAALGVPMDELVGTDTYMKPQLRPEAMRIAVEVDTLLREALSQRP